MILSIHQCDICQVKSDDYQTWGTWGMYHSCDGKQHEVCTACETRLIAPLVEQCQRPAA